MKKKLQKLTSLIMAIAMVLTCAAVTAGAEESEEESLGATEQADIEIGLYWAELMSIKPSINVSNGKASVIASVSAYSNITSLKITATIQKSNILWWSDVKTFTKTCTGSTGTLSESYSVGSGTYRLKVTVTAYQNGVVKETVTVYS